MTQNLDEISKCIYQIYGLHSKCISANFKYTNCIFIQICIFSNSEIVKFPRKFVLSGPHWSQRYPLTALVLLYVDCTQMARRTLKWLRWMGPEGVDAVSVMPVFSPHGILMCYEASIVPCAHLGSSIWASLFTAFILITPIVTNLLLSVSTSTRRRRFLSADLIKPVFVRVQGLGFWALKG